MNTTLNKTLNNDTSIKNQIDSLETPSLTTRFFAFLIDLIFGYLSILLFLRIGLGISFNTVIQPWGWGRLFIIYMFFIYFFSFLFFMNGQTLGYKLFKIKVISISTRKINFFSSFLRSIFLALFAFPIVLGRLSLYMAGSFLFISLLSLYFGDTKRNKQTFWDAGSKTIVIKKLDNHHI